MRRSTKVGHAYVAITADGSNIGKDIADSFDDVDYNEIADRFDRDYADKIRARLDSLQGDFIDHVDRMDKAFQTRLDLETGVRKKLAEAIDIAGPEMERLFEHVGREAGVSMGSGFDDVIKRSIIDSMERSLHRAVQSGALDLNDLTSERDGLVLPRGFETDAIKEVRAAAARRQREQDEYAAMYAKLLDQRDEAERENQNLAEKFAAARENLQKKSNEAILQSDEDLRRRQEKLYERLRREAEKDANEKAELAAKFAASRERLHQKSNEVIAKADADLRRRQEKDLDALRIQQEKVFEQLKARASDDALFRMFDTHARKQIQKIRFDPTIDEDSIRKVQRELRSQLEERYKYTIQLKGDLSERERDAIQEKIRQLDTKIRLNVDEDHLNRQLLGAQSKLRGVSGNDRNFGDRVGRLFGAGSRSNLLNLLGRTIGNITSAVSKLTTGALRLGSSFVRGFKAAEEGASFFGKVLSGLGTKGLNAAGAFSKLAASLPAIAIGATVAIGVLSILASVISALTALVTGLVSVIVSGLTGGLLVLGGVLTAVAASAGLLVVAFKSMYDEQKKAMSETFYPLKEILTGIGQTMIREMIPAFSTWSSNLQRALLQINPLAASMGRAFADAGSTITASLSGPGFQNLFRAFGVFLPGIVRNLSSALGGFLNGMMGIFAAIMPLVSQFAKYLSDTATRFSEWANSAKGQNSIVDFANRAVESLKSLWNFVREFFGFLGDLLFSPQAQAAGTTMFDSLTKSFKGFRDAIAKAQANGDLEKWFDTAIDLGHDFKQLLIGLKDAFVALESDGTLATFGNIVNGLGKTISAVVKAKKKQDEFNNSLGGLPKIITGVVNPLTSFQTVLGTVRDGLDRTGGSAGTTGSRLWQMARDAIEAARRLQDVRNLLNGSGLGGTTSVPSDTNPFTTFGNELGKGDKKKGGKTPPKNPYSGIPLPSAYTPKAPKGPKQYHNPYVKFANRLIKQNESAGVKIRDSMNEVNKAIREALSGAAKAISVDDARSNLSEGISKIRDTGKSLVDSARQQLSSAASRLASASSAKAAAKAFKEVRRAQKGLAKAIKAQKAMNRQITDLSTQKVVRSGVAEKLAEGLRVQNVTLAEYAKARALVAEMLEKANQDLTNQIQMRDSYREQVESSIRDFGALTTAQAQVIDGIEQALTSNDIISNLEDRLGQIQKFQENLRKLAALGLSDDAYKQIVDAGVEQGNIFAESLLAGGAGAIQQTNDLVKGINSLSDSLGLEASNRMYQAGVDAAQGLVDGLNSRAKELDEAATRLGDAIAAAVAKALGIKSPSKRLYDMMGDVGDGAVLGLDAQHAKVGAAGQRFADQIAVSPEVAAYAARQGDAGTVSGNTNQRFRDLIINTPTEDPYAVAMETMNEVTGRL